MNGSSKRGRPSATSTQARKVAPLFEPPAPPAHLVPEHAEIWAEAAALLISRRALTPGLLPDLELYTSELAALRQMDRELAESGLMVKGKPHPLITPRRYAAAAVYRLSMRLGLNPKPAGSQATADPHAADTTDTSMDF